ncbi:MAG TPA: peptidase inhibitor family I36 protein [Candidatus Limnocylindrales bacterium]|nr:peptidase inhibitor family I36 protein [Candidatus Limnocylindrales bacterium]
MNLKIRLGMTLSAAAIAVAGSLAAVATPAYAADEAEGGHCVSTVPETNVRCFGTYEEAKAFVASVAEVGSEKGPGSAARLEYSQAMAAKQLAFWPVWIFTAFDWENYDPFGGSWWIIGLSGSCTTTTADLDYSDSVLPARWDNDISSYLNGGNCWTKLYEDPFFGGSSRGYTGSSPTLGAWNNRASSIKWS